MNPAQDPGDGCDDDRLVRAHLSRVAEPGDRALPADDEPERRRGLLDRLRAGRGPEVWQARHARLDEPTTAFVARAARLGVGLVVPEDRCWPEGLGDLRQLPVRDGADGGAPVCLWVRGTLPAAAGAPPVAAVVGSRACSAYGQHVAEDLAAGLVTRGWTVVSGAAYGIDAAAHRGALALGDEARAPTVAVLAGGAEKASPAGHEQLLRRTVDCGGAVVSEVPPGTRPAPYRFLLRNRLIAAWGLGVVVVEASHRSGALNTARTAGDLSRHVAAVPGPVTSVMSVGTNRLLRDGAACVTGADDVVELLGRMGLFGSPLGPGQEPGEPGEPGEAGELWEPGTRGAAGTPRAGPDGVGNRVRGVDPSRLVESLGPEASRVWRGLRARGPRDVEELVVAVGLGHRAVARGLAVLELAGAAVRSEQGWRRGDTGGAAAGVVP
ncbi:DNA-processing protein DprA [Aquipuribacter sp. MA13-6]|uniref:DNA-processing protein DprA n=1 Tax=unclassified Aquipuribacter TaxID=2635084 RepID=UPI003EE8890B